MSESIHRLAQGWSELESDPGLFTLLLEDFGVQGVQLDEIYDIQEPIRDGPVYGFVFLFQWVEERRSRNRRKPANKSGKFVKDEDVVRGMFFARQMIPNSCATHALLSVLLNRSDVHLGETLERLKGITRGLDPEDKGWAIGNIPELARAHNSYAVPERGGVVPQTNASTSSANVQYAGDTYHFVSYVPIDGRLYELDGLKPYPMDHGPWAEDEDWTVKFRKVIGDRLKAAAERDGSRFNLMAVVPDKRLAIKSKVYTLKENRRIVLDALQERVFKNIPSNVNDERDVTEMSPVPGTSKDFIDEKICPESNNIIKIQSVQSSIGSEDNGNSKDIKSVHLEGAMGKRCEDEEIEKSKSSGKENNNDLKLKKSLKSNNGFSEKDLLTLVQNLQQEININEGILREENEKRMKYKIDSSRRTHNYDAFISTFLAMLAEKRILPGLIQKQLDIHKEKANAKPSPSVQSQSKKQIQVKSGTKKTSSKSTSKATSVGVTTKCKTTTKK